MRSSDTTGLHRHVVDPMVLDAARSLILRRARGLTKLQSLRIQIRGLYMRWRAIPENLFNERSADGSQGPYRPALSE
jgi:hypothetical protein